MLSHKMREVIIRPNGANKDSKSGWVMFLGKPLTYKLAPLIASELGRANETYKSMFNIIQKVFSEKFSSYSL